MKELVEKHQQVPVLAWFFTGVAGFSLTTVNSYLYCAVAAVPMKSAAAAINKVFFMIVYFKCIKLFSRQFVIDQV
jgi:hypothetical protein